MVPQHFQLFASQISIYFLQFLSFFNREYLQHITDRWLCVILLAVFLWILFFVRVHVFFIHQCTTLPISSSHATNCLDSERRHLYHWPQERIKLPPRGTTCDFLHNYVSCTLQNFLMCCSDDVFKGCVCTR